MKQFVVVIDTQRDFMAADGALSVAGAESLIPGLERFLADLDPERVAGVLFTYDTHETEAYARSSEADEFPPHCLKGTPGWDNVLSPAVVDPGIPVYRLEKGVFDMWAEPDLALSDARDAAALPARRDAFFEMLKADGVGAVTVVGVAADYCVKWAVEGLLARGFDVTVPEALTRGIVRQIHAVAAEDFGGRLRILPADAAAAA
jgi:nicotinamidase/pyrazinamidase